MDITVSVSYTHLDVYKRQLLILLPMKKQEGFGLKTMIMYEQKVHEVSTKSINSLYILTLHKRTCDSI